MITCLNMLHFVADLLIFKLQRVTVCISFYDVCPHCVLFVHIYDCIIDKFTLKFYNKLQNLAVNKNRTVTSGLTKSPLVWMRHQKALCVTFGGIT